MRKFCYTAGLFLFQACTTTSSSASHPAFQPDYLMSIDFIDQANTCSDVVSALHQIPGCLAWHIVEHSHWMPRCRRIEVWYRNVNEDSILVLKRNLHQCPGIIEIQAVKL
jgi:hypothetical protein